MEMRTVRQVATRPASHRPTTHTPDQPTPPSAGSRLSRTRTPRQRHLTWVGSRTHPSLPHRPALRGRLRQGSRQHPLPSRQAHPQAAPRCTLLGRLAVRGDHRGTCPRSSATTPGCLCSTKTPGKPDGPGISSLAISQPHRHDPGHRRCHRCRPHRLHPRHRTLRDAQQTRGLLRCVTHRGQQRCGPRRATAGKAAALS